MLDTLQFHHIGVATPDIEATSAMYVSAGYTKSDNVHDPIQNVMICFLTKEGMPTIELLAPIDSNSPVVKTIEKSGVSPYHCCYLSSDMENDIKSLRKLKYVVVSKPVEACALGGKRVSFLYHKNVGLIELLEK